MNICMNEEICTNVCASMDGVRHCGVAYHTLCSSLMIFNVLLLLPHLPEMSGLLHGQVREAGGEATTTQAPCAGCARAAPFSKRKCIEHTRSAWVRNLLLKIGVGTLSAIHPFVFHSSSPSLFCLPYA